MELLDKGPTRLLVQVSLGKDGGVGSSKTQHRCRTKAGRGGYRVWVQ